MKIKEMFRDNIDRTINGVVQVGENEKNVVEQEVKEYVVTSELKKHYSKFFTEYSESFDKSTDKVGVWITGFFGSGKSHFLKMLSYLLENKEIGDRNVVDYFEDKFDDELTFMNIRKCVQKPTETILFNIDAKSSGSKTENSIREVFYKVFYDHIGLFGNDLKVAKLEQFIIKKGKMAEFKEAFERINGDTWENSRAEYDFFETDVEDALVEADVMSRKNAEHWFEHAEIADTSPESLVNEVKKYVDSKGKDFHLLFMIDEAGQFIGESTSMLLNLQSLIELFGSVCHGQVWVIASGQEALDDMAIKLREDEFSRIMARFPIRLSLTSSSVGEVIEKRLLTKTEDATSVLDGVYENNENALKNLYAFDTEVKDLKGYSSEAEFVHVFPFVPYQFTLMQKVFNEIRKHGHAGKHQSSGERSMLNGFQESAQRVENENELTLVPMYAFYDTLHSFLDTSVRSVIERAEKLANSNVGLTQDDVNLLKLLYLVRYIDDIKSNIENLTILMADSINVDKVVLRKSVAESLNRLEKQNYISRNGDVYLFLTDEEQDIAREISNQTIDAANVISQICKTIFDDLYTTKKFKYTENHFNCDFDFDKSVDGQNHGNTTGGMKLHFVTEAYDDTSDIKLATVSKGEVICKLSTEYSIFSDIENALKIDKYTKQKQINQLPESMQNIIGNKQKEKTRLLLEAKENIANAIIKGKFFIDGKEQSVSGASVKAVLDNALKVLVEATYSKMSYITRQIESEEELRNLSRAINLEDIDTNKEACEEVYNYIRLQENMKMPSTMADIQSRFQVIPYGWKEIDIVAVIILLLRDQKVLVKHNGQVIGLKDYQLIDCLRLKSKIGFTKINIREKIPAQKLNKVRDILSDYFNKQDIPKDEDKLVEYIVDSFKKQREELQKMDKKNEASPHPGSQDIKTGLDLIGQVLFVQNDHLALINRICELENDLLDNKEETDKVNEFYNNQIKLYDEAVSLRKQVVNNEKDYLMHNPNVENAINQIIEITSLSSKTFKFSRIPELNTCISTINEERRKVVDEKRLEASDLILSCVKELELKANNEAKLQDELNKAIKKFDEIKHEVKSMNNIVALEAKKSAITSLKDIELSKMDRILNEDQVQTPATIVKPKKNVRQLQRAVVFNQANLSSEEEIEKYVMNIKNKLLSYLNDEEDVEIEIK